MICRICGICRIYGIYGICRICGILRICGICRICGVCGICGFWLVSRCCKLFQRSKPSLRKYVCNNESTHTNTSPGGESLRPIRENSVIDGRLLQGKTESKAHRCTPLPRSPALLPSVKNFLSQFPQLLLAFLKVRPNFSHCKPGPSQYTDRSVRLFVSGKVR